MSLIPVPIPKSLPPIPDGYTYIGMLGVDFTNDKRFTGAYLYEGRWDKGMMAGATAADDNTGKHYAIKDGADTSMITQMIAIEGVEPTPDKMLEYPGTKSSIVIPMPPEGSVIIGRGGQVPWETKFEGWVYRLNRPEWGWQALHNLNATMSDWIYAVPVGSKTHEFLVKKSNTHSPWVRENTERKKYRKIFEYYDKIKPQPQKDTTTLTTPFFTINLKSI